MSDKLTASVVFSRLLRSLVLWKHGYPEWNYLM